MNNKTFCVLEQGGYPNEELTEIHKRQFNTDVSDFYRLNFKTDDDPNAFITGFDTTHPEGRNLLFEHVPKKYDYYIFIDDDVVFKDENPANKIAALLEEYKPISATFYDKQKQWHSIKNYSGGPSVSPILSFDLAVSIYSESAANVIFPQFWHSEDVPRFNQYMFSSAYPEKQMMFYDIVIDNSESRDQDLLKFDPVENATNKFMSTVVKPEVWGPYHKSGPGWKKWIFSENMKLLQNVQVSKNEVEFTMDDYCKFIDCDSENFVNRKSVYERTNI